MSIKQIYIFLAIICFSFSSCSKEEEKTNSSLPYYRFSYFINRNNPSHSNLHLSSCPVYILEDKYNRKMGYREHGLFIVLNGTSYIAFDATCPNHKGDFSKTIEYKKGSLFFICPDCGNKYNILSGECIKKGFLPLQFYNTQILTNGYLNIYN